MSPRNARRLAARLKLGDRAAIRAAIKSAVARNDQKDHEGK